MAFLQWSDIMFYYTMQGPSSFLFGAGMRMLAKGPAIADLATPFLDAAVDTNTVFIDTDRGYRDSYGRYYKTEANEDRIWVTASAENRGLWEKASFTYGFVFRDNSTNTGSGPGRVLMSKPTTSATGTNIGNQLAMDDVGVAGQFGWRCNQQIGNPEVALIQSVPKLNFIVGYVIKADGVLSKIGLKIKGDSSWTTATATGSPITVDYDNTKNAALLGKINKDTGAKEHPFWGNLQKFCMWGVAIDEATVQSDLEDHFGRADTAGGGGSGRIRSRIMMPVASRGVIV